MGAGRRWLQGVCQANIGVPVVDRGWCDIVLILARDSNLVLSQCGGVLTDICPVDNQIYRVIKQSYFRSQIIRNANTSYGH